MSHGRSDVTVGDLGERALIDRIAPHFGPPAGDEIWSGDDAAYFEAPGGGLLFTTDLMVENVDWRPSYASGFDVGWKVVAINVSDIAAMGGSPWRAVATVSLRADTEIAFVDDLAAGMAAAGREYGVGIAGGDLSSGREIGVSMAMVGVVATGTDGPVLRRGARPGDALCVTGALGGAAGGLLVLQEGLPSGVARDTLVERQLRPRARAVEGQALAGIATAMIDLSDGLAVDLGHLTEASGVGCEVDLDALPIDAGLSWLASVRKDADPLRLAVSGGEDFELLLALDEASLDEARTRLRASATDLTRIGTVTVGPPSIGGRELDDWRAEAWEHLRDP